MDARMHVDQQAHMCPASKLGMRAIQVMCQHSLLPARTVNPARGILAQLTQHASGLDALHNCTHVQHERRCMYTVSAWPPGC